MADQTILDRTLAAATRDPQFETERRLELRAFQERRSRSDDPDGAEFQHAGLRHTPNALTLVRELPRGFNLLAAEC